MYRAGVASLALVALTLAVSGAYAQTSVTMVDGSLLVQFTNVYDDAIDRIAIWITTDHAIDLYLTEPGWRVVSEEQSIQLVGGVLEPGQSTKAGIKFRGDEVHVAWLMAAGEDVVERGWLLREGLSSGTGMHDDALGAGASIGILPESSFYTIPSKPAEGSTIRMVGAGFGPGQILEASAGGVSAGTFSTNAAGGFVATLVLHPSLTDRIEFVITDAQGNKSPPLSLRLEPAPPASMADGSLSIDAIGESHNPGDRLVISGTARPGSTLVATMLNPEGQMVTTMPVSVDMSGQWRLLGDVVIPLDAPLGEYAVLVGNGRSTAEASWTVESGTLILVKPARSMFNPGEPLQFSGEVVPEVPVSVILQGPTGNELVIDSVQVGPDGIMSWEYPTAENFRRGTYTLVVSQGAERQFVYAGLGSEVEIPLRLSFDKSNYLPSDTPLVTIEGEPGVSVSFLVADPADTVVYEDVITLQTNGRVEYELAIGNFSTGVHTAIAQKGTTQNSYRFGIGLSSGATLLDIQTESRYEPGEQVLILGSATPNAVLRITLSDPSGELVQSIDTFSDRTGLISERTIRIPMSAVSGDWTLRASSGQTSDTAIISVSGAEDAGLSVAVETVGQSTSIVVSGARSTYVSVTIMDGDVVIGEPLRSYVTSAGVGKLPWDIDVSGTYTIIVNDGSDTAQTTYQYVRR